MPPPTPHNCLSASAALNLPDLSIVHTKFSVTGCCLLASTITIALSVLPGRGQLWPGARPPAPSQHKLTKPFYHCFVTLYTSHAATSPLPIPCVLISNRLVSIWVTKTNPTQSRKTNKRSTPIVIAKVGQVSCSPWGVDESDLTRMKCRESLQPGSQQTSKSTLGQHVRLPCRGGEGGKR